MPELTFKPIDKANWREAARLKVNPDQENFVAPNTISMLQAIYDDDFEGNPYGIYDGETMIGFILPVWSSVWSEESRAEQALWIMRYMIGADYQRKGYGRAALQQFIEQTRAAGIYKHIKLSYVPENTVAKALYASVGFVEEGIKEEWGEMIARLDL